MSAMMSCQYDDECLTLGPTATTVLLLSFLPSSQKPLSLSSCFLSPSDPFTDADEFKLRPAVKCEKPRAKDGLTQARANGTSSG